MSTNTTNYNLTKPEGTDFYDVEVFNDNLDIIDEKIKANENSASANADSISDNASGISANADAISDNASAISTNAQSISNNASSITNFEDMASQMVSGVDLSSGDYTLASADYYIGLIVVSTADDTNALILPSVNNHKYDIYNADSSTALIVKKSGSSNPVEIPPSSMCRVAYDGTEYRMMIESGFPKISSPSVSSGTVAGNCMLISEDGSEWEPSQQGVGIYDGKNIVLLGEVTLSGLDTGYNYYSQSDGSISTTLSDYPVGIALSDTVLMVKTDCEWGRPKEYSENMVQAFALPGYSGSVLIKSEMPSNADGVMWRYKTSTEGPWEAGDDETTGTLITNLTTDYNSANEWYTASGLTNNETYYFKAFPHRSGLYNAIIGQNEDSVYTQAIGALYTFDNLSGSTVLDELEGSYDLTGSNLTSSTGKINTAMLFGDSGVATRTNMMTAIGTQMFWVKMSSGSTFWGPGNLIYTGTRTRGFQFSINSSLYPYIEIGNYEYNTGHYTYSASGAAITADTWTHVAFSHSAEETKIYINGVLMATKSTETINMTSVATFRIGERAWVSGGTYSDDVLIDQFVSSNERLSDENIAKFALAEVA